MEWVTRFMSAIKEKIMVAGLYKTVLHSLAVLCINMVRFEGKVG
jgi:hypothetical protein